MVTGSLATQLLLGVLNLAAHEASVLLSTDHPSVCKLHAVYETSSKLWLVMEYIQGKDLCEWLAARRREMVLCIQLLLLLLQVLSSGAKHVLCLVRSSMLLLTCGSNKKSSMEHSNGRIVGTV